MEAITSADVTSFASRLGRAGSLSVAELPEGLDIFRDQTVDSFSETRRSQRSRLSEIGRVEVFAIIFDPNPHSVVLAAVESPPAGGPPVGLHRRESRDLRARHTGDTRLSLHRLLNGELFGNGPIGRDTCILGND